MKGNATVQMVQYSPETNQPITTLKSLKEPADDDHSSLQSQRYNERSLSNRNKIILPTNP